MSRLVEPSALTPEARVALINTHYRKGSTIPPGTPAGVIVILFKLQLINDRGALTEAGAIVRARCIDSALDEMEARAGQ